MHDRGLIAASAVDEGSIGVVVNLLPFVHVATAPSHGFEIFHDGGKQGAPLELRDVLRYHGCPAWGTWRFARHLADLTSRDHLYFLRQSAVFDAGSAARRIVDLAAKNGCDAMAFLSETPRPGRELRWALAVPPASLSNFGKSPSHSNPRRIELLRFPYEIPGLRDATGRLMFSEDCRALVTAMNEWLAEMDAEPLVPFQKWSTAEGAWAFSLPIGGEWCPSRLKAAEGRVEIALSPHLAERLADLIDDQDARDGQTRMRKLVYEWVSGKTAAGFVRKLRSEMDRAFDLLAGPSSGSN